MTSYCIYKYLKNESVVSVSHKIFHDTPDDVYPSISICFQSLSGPFVDTRDIKKNDIAEMMNGSTTFNQSLLDNLTYNDITLKLEIENFMFQILPRTWRQEPCNNSGCFTTFGDGWVKCFTHDIKYKHKQNYRTLSFNVKKSWEQGSQIINLFLHHPGQLFRSAIQYFSIQNKNRINFNIQSVTVLRKRNTEITACSTESSDDDRILFENIAKQFNCRALYPGQL